MSEAVTIALIGGGAGIITALTVFISKVYDIYREHRGETMEKRVAETVKPIIDDAIRPVLEAQEYMQRDVTRMRLLDLIRHEPDDAENILMVGKIYFDGFHGNSEASKQFDKWLKQEKIKKPSWFVWEEK